MGLNDIFIRVLCIGSALLYAASASLIAAPQTKLPPSISKLLLLNNDQSSEFIARTAQDQFLVSNVTSRLNSLESLFRIIGSLQQPLAIVIDRDRPLRVSIGTSDVVIGIRAASARGQLEHAMIKAWIKQSASSEVLNSPLRAQVYADLLLASYLGKLDLQDPEVPQNAQFGDLSNWMDDLSGTAELCNSAWRPAELISYCDGVKKNQYGTQTSYSLRKVIGSLIWKDLSVLNFTERRAVLTKLSHNIRSQTLNASTVRQLNTASNKKIESLEELRQTIESEAFEIYPGLVSRLPVMLPTIGILKSKSLSLVGGFEINVTTPIKFRKVIVETCAAPTLSELLAQTSEETEHILLVQNCENNRMNYSGFVKYGAARFAFDNRETKFTYLHRASLKLASKMITNFDIISALAFDPTSKDAKFLGLDQKIFKEDVGAYKVNGPIGAIEWYRSKILPQNT